MMEILTNADVTIIDHRGVEFDGIVERNFNTQKYYLVRITVFNLGLIVAREQFISPSRVKLDEAQTEWFREQSFFH